MWYVAHMFHCTKMFFLTPIWAWKQSTWKHLKQVVIVKIIFLMETHCSTMIWGFWPHCLCNKLTFPDHPSLFSSLWLCLQDVRQSGITSDAGWELKSARWWTYPAPKSSSTSPVIKVGLRLYLNREKLFVSFQLITTTNGDKSMPEHQRSVTSTLCGNLSYVNWTNVTLIKEQCELFIILC